MILVQLLIYIYNNILKSNIKFKSRICLLIMNSNKSTIIQWQKLLDKIENYFFRANQFISNIHFDRDIYLMTRKTVEWKSLEIHHKMLDSKIPHKTSCWINLIKANKIKRIMKSKFIILIYADNNYISPALHEINIDIN